MTKQEIRAELIGGRSLSELLEFTDGQDCIIFKADKFFVDNEVCYIPDVDLNEIPIDKVSLDRETIDEIIGHCYTGNDFVDECGGDKETAERLFWYVDWQHPCSAVDEVADDEEYINDEGVKGRVYLNTTRYGYTPDQAGETLSVGELIELLSEYDLELPVYFRNDDGYTYGYLTERTVRCSDDYSDDE